MKIYLSGPMTGVPQFNIPMFDAKARRLREMGHEVISPAEEDGPETRMRLLMSDTGSLEDYPAGETWGTYLARDVKIIADEGIEAVVVLHGWWTSKGARLETFVAHLKGLPIFRHDGSGLHEVPRIDLYRAWTQEPTLAIPATLGVASEA